jgi:hypothetical protein
VSGNTKGPTVGRLFPLHFSVPSCLSLACVTVNTPNIVWHKRLGHPNSVILSHMLNFGLLGKKNKFLKICHLIVLYTNLVKVRPFRSFLMVVMLKNALILCIVMYEVFLLFFLMLDINIL